MSTPYYNKGRTVFCRPKGGSIGFLVCECSEYVEDAAKVVADALNFVAACKQMTYDPLERDAIDVMLTAARKIDV